MLDKTFTEAMEAYAQHLVNDYEGWTTASKFKRAEKEKMIVTFEEGSKFVRVVASTYGSRSSHSFIVKQADKWPLGTILKCASWKAPAQNFARGNIFTKESYEKRARWSGIS